MSEHEELWPMFKAIIKAVETDWTGHLPDCGYTAEHQECGCAEFGGKVYAALKPFAARLADAKARAEAAEASLERWEAAIDDYENRAFAAEHRAKQAEAKVARVEELAASMRRLHLPEWRVVTDRIDEALRGDQ